ncbi:MAG TPA: DUF4430 domain-containing protein [Candidatus Paceibacterota bacterium]
MNIKQYTALIVTVVVLGAATYASQKAFLSYSSRTTSSIEQMHNSKDVATGTASIVIGNKHYEIAFRDGMTALETMRAAEPAGFMFSGKEFPSLGFFVESINGQTAPDGYYWIFYVNGTQSNTGISQTIISSGDTIEWRLDKSY